MVNFIMNPSHRAVTSVMTKFSERDYYSHYGAKMGHE